MDILLYMIQKVFVKSIWLNMELIIHILSLHIECTYFPFSMYNMNKEVTIYTLIFFIAICGLRSNKWVIMLFLKLKYIMDWCRKNILKRLLNLAEKRMQESRKKKKIVVSRCVASVQWLGLFRESLIYRDVSCPPQLPRRLCPITPILYLYYAPPRRRRRPKLLPISMCHSKLFGIVLAWFHCPRLSPPCADTPCRRRLGRRPTTTPAIRRRAGRPRRCAQRLNGSALVVGLYAPRRAAPRVYLLRVGTWYVLSSSVKRELERSVHGMRAPLIYACTSSNTFN